MTTLYTGYEGDGGDEHQKVFDPPPAAEQGGPNWSPPPAPEPPPSEPPGPVKWSLSAWLDGPPVAEGERE